MKKVIAFYLPQYHPTPSNDAWWGKGFTEWTNVAKARRLYPGHYQPKIPTELGFYDLRLPEVRKQQAEMARQAGIYGFCYYHYWFSESRQELDLPFREVVASGEPDFPFCLCWANESWHSKFWNKDGTTKKQLLAEQLYLGEADNKAHFMSLLSAFQDKRYIKVDGRLLFMIYKPLDFQHFTEFRDQWNQLAAEHGLPSFYFVGYTMQTEEIQAIQQMGFDAVNHCYRLDFLYQYHPEYIVRRKCINLLKRFVPVPFIVPYRKAIKRCICPEDYQERVYPTMMPNWDHTPRSVTGGTVLHGSTPELFRQHASAILAVADTKPAEHQIVFLKSWNEWGEGNYMEPDLRFGRGYINALRDAINSELK